MTVLAVLAGGMLGAPARYLADRIIQARRDTVFPWGTFAVNVTGSAVVGFLLGAQTHLGLPAVVFALLATGFCGGLTTFSTFGYETVRLLEDGALGEAGINVIGSLVVAVLAAWLGFRLAVALLARSKTRPAGSRRRLARPVPGSARLHPARRVECRGSSTYRPGMARAGRPSCPHSQRGRSWSPAVRAA